MNKDSLYKKRRIKSIKTKEEYNRYKDSLNLTEEQKLLFDLVFIH